jgi:hypothetical protein
VVGTSSDDFLIGGSRKFTATHAGGWLIGLRGQIPLVTTRWSPCPFHLGVWIRWYHGDVATAPQTPRHDSGPSRSRIERAPEGPEGILRTMFRQLPLRADVERGVCAICRWGGLDGQVPPADSVDGPIAGRETDGSVVGDRVRTRPGTDVEKATIRSIRLQACFRTPPGTARGAPLRRQVGASGSSTGEGFHVKHSRRKA